jgi:uncharacterized protein
MAILKLETASSSQASAFDDWGAVGQPLSEPPCQLRGKKLVLPIENAPEMGVWECTPGRYRRQIRSAESMHVISGSATFTPDEGEPVALHAGDVYFFPPETLGVWDVHSVFRKLYVLFTPATKG